MRYTKAQLMLVSLLVCVLPAADCQVLDLFEELEANGRPSRENSSPGVRRDREGNILSDIYFRLVGTSRIGSSYIITVRDQGGEIISFTTTLETERPVPGYTGYSLVDVGPKKVSIRYPDGSPCIDHSEEGVKCLLGNLAEVSLTNGSPLASNLTSSIDSLSTSVDAGAEEDLQNPFEAILERQSNPNPEPGDTTFTPRRISPEDVPPGMRVVSTPFGDRLVEDE